MKPTHIVCIPDEEAIQEKLGRKGTRKDKQWDGALKELEDEDDSIQQVDNSSLEGKLEQAKRAKEMGQG